MKGQNFVSFKRDSSEITEGYSRKTSLFFFHVYFITQIRFY